MPTYEFLNKKTKKVEEHLLTIAQYDQFKIDNPHLERYYSEAPGFNYTSGGDLSGKKTDNTWKEVMQKIAEQNPRSPLADQHLRKSAKRIKTDEVIKKHNKRLAKTK
jgi:hypothetical protein